MRFMNAIKRFVGLLVGSCVVASVGAQTLAAYTEEWAPYNFQEGPLVKGISADLLRESCEAARLRCNLQLMPWARAIKLVRGTPNTVLFTTARKPDRENDFLWVGPILPRSTWVYVRPEIAAANVRELKTLRFGIVRDEAAQRDLLKAGVPPGAMVEDSSNTAILRLMLSGVVDAMVDTEVAMAWSVRNSGLDAATVVKHVKLTDEGAYYFALNLQSDPAVVERLQTALDKLRRQGRVEALVRRYTQK